ncbi:MAG: thiamine-phosphate kinase [Candidatus Altiarchaeota archaeon]|nr:thiamine-phosphate kinase [Candidatus Altiarchaeota archaeon]
MMLSDLGEKGIIKELSKYLDIGDDAAYIKSGDKYLILTTDMVYEDTHILPQLSWEQKGRLIVTVNLSDIAAMGAKPIAFLLGYGSPDMEHKDFKAFIKGVHDQCNRFKTKFVGGDTNWMPKLTLSGTMVGETKNPVLRSGAKEGDLIAVTGNLGSASIGTKILLEKSISTSEFGNPVFMKAIQPEPRVDEGFFLNQHVNAMTDLSDGLATSLRDVAVNSGVGVRIDLRKLPVAEEATILAAEYGLDSVEHALYGEGDYELLFTSNREEINVISRELSAYVIGEITGGEAIVAVDSTREFEIKEQGYEHFRSSPQKT